MTVDEFTAQLTAHIRQEADVVAELCGAAVFAEFIIDEEAITWRVELRIRTGKVGLSGKIPAFCVTESVMPTYLIECAGNRVRHQLLTILMADARERLRDQVAL